MSRLKPGIHLGRSATTRGRSATVAAIAVTVGILSLALPGLAAGQTVVQVAPVPGDSTAPAPGTDSTRSPATGAASPGSTPAPPVQPAAAPAAPADSTLRRACSGEPPGSEAPGLLTVVFQRGTIDRDRAAAAKAVGATLGATNDYGEEYVLVPATAGPLVVVADRLILQRPVVEVSHPICP